MSKKNESAIERLAKIKAEKEAARTAAKNVDLVGQLTHDSTGEPDFAEIADKLKARKNEEKVSVMAGAVKYTIYIDQDVATAFDALCVKRGDQRRYANEALKDFVQKKVRELGI